MSSLFAPIQPPRAAKIAAVATKAESLGFDSERAESAILAHLATSAGTAEQIIAAIRTPDNEPHDERAYGQIFASLSRRGLIVKAGSAPRYTGNPCWIWKLA